MDSRTHGTELVPAQPPTAVRVHPAIAERVWQTPLIDTHEHLPEERDRLSGAPHPAIKADDWSLLLSHYLNSDLLVAGMSQADYDRFFAPTVDPLDKWQYLAPYWPAVKNTGYGRAVQIALQQLYDVVELSSATVAQVQAGYEATRRPGFYREILCERARIESCQVDAGPFRKSAMPTLLMADINFVGMIAGPNFEGYGKPSGIEVRTLSDWHRVIDWWYDQYGQYAVATKSAHAYARDINYERVPAEAVEAIFSKRLAGDRLTPAEQRSLEDHLFWYAVDKATELQLPIKLHTGYYASHNLMPLDRLRRNPGSAAELCGRAPQSRFVFMHIGYPYYEEMIALAKQYTNAYIDMCWSWIINPVASKDFLKKFLVCAPSNKILPFGGDYIPVEPVVGHAWMARQGIALALSELVEERWMSLADALDLVDPIMHGNARRLFRLEEKTRLLQHVPWS
ncbi:MAG: amidohydrolase [Pirellulaceae bacterium]|nr:amidohydrolase [Pirellulaceae bacterium]